MGGYYRSMNDPKHWIGKVPVSTRVIHIHVFVAGVVIGTIRPHPATPIPGDRLAPSLSGVQRASLVARFGSHENSQYPGVWS